jgi:hypothetical protein
MDDLARALEGLTEVFAELARAFDRLDVDMDRWVDVEATAEQRALYTGLIACGTERLDAIAEAIDLAP